MQFDCRLTLDISDNTMASMYGMITTIDNGDLIPIYYRVPFGSGHEIISGYLEKKELPKGSKQKRFYGHYQCGDCSNRWKSGNAWQGYTQDCKNCGVRNWPFKVYHLEQSVDPLDGKAHKSELCGRCRELGYNCRTGDDLGHNWRLCGACVSQGYNCQTGIELPHNSKSCQKCRELGHYCQTDNFGKDYKSSPTRHSARPSKYDVCFSKQFELLKYNIMIEQKFIRDLYVALWPDLSPAEEQDFIQGLRNVQREWKTRGKLELVEACEDILDEISN